MAEGTQGFQVGECRLDLDRGTLTRGGALVPIRAKAFGLLCHLARNVGRVVSKDELLDAVWPGVTVTEDSLTQAMRDLRRAIGDERGEIVRTIPRRGYLFAIPLGAPAPAAPAGAMPRVAVLPFRNLTGDTGDGILIDGLVEEITNGLARFKTVTIIARHSAFAFRPEDGASPDEIASRLGADFLVEGSARRAGGRFVIAAGLAEARAGRQALGRELRLRGRGAPVAAAGHPPPDHPAAGQQHRGLGARPDGGGADRQPLGLRALRPRGGAPAELRRGGERAGRATTCCTPSRPTRALRWRTPTSRWRRW